LRALLQALIRAVHSIAHLHTKSALLRCNAEGSFESMEKVLAATRDSRRSAPSGRGGGPPDVGAGPSAPPPAPAAAAPLLPPQSHPAYVNDSERVVEFHVYIAGREQPRVVTMPWGTPVTAITDVVRKAGIVEQLQGRIQLMAPEAEEDVSDRCAGEVAAMCKVQVCVQLT
jgi:hypothetical protein